MENDNLTEESNANREADVFDQAAEVVWPQITGRRGGAARLALIIWSPLFPFPTSPIDHEVFYRNNRAIAEQTFAECYDFWEQINTRNPSHLVVNEQRTEIRADALIAADLRSACCALLSDVLEYHADYLLDCGETGENALGCFDQFAALQLDETYNYKWMPGTKAVGLRAEDHAIAFFRATRDVIFGVRVRLVPLAWNVERQLTDEQLYRSPIEETSQSAGRNGGANAAAGISGLSPVESLQMVRPIADILVADEPISSATVSQPTLGGRPHNLAVEYAQSWHLNLRAARAGKKLSRRAAAARLVKQGAQITIHAIKKHEEGKAKPRPAVRRAYAAIYEVSEKSLFAGE